MTFMRFLCTSIVVGLGFGGCSSALTNTPVSKSADGWAITLSQVKEGPDEYIGEGGVRLAADEGEKLVWVLVTVKNDSPQEQTFTYDNCVLEGKVPPKRPLTVARSLDEEVGAAVDRSESVNPGQEHTRQLIYNYPKDQKPTRVRCDTIALPIKYSH